MKEGQRRAGKTFIRRHSLKLILASGIVAISLWSGCIDVPTEKVTYEEELTVHCILRADWGPSRVYVGKTLNIEEPEADVAVSGATVLLSGDGEEVHYNEVPGTPGVYHPAGHFIVRNNSTYTLDVSDLSGRSVSATTTVPGYFQILSPLFGDSVEKDNDLRIVWSKSTGAEEYHIHVDLRVGNLTYNYLSYVFSDTTLVIPAERFYTDIEGEVYGIELDIYAVDGNYAGYTRSDPEDPDSPDINHIPGAKGVFGSATKTFGFFYFK